MPSFLSGYTKRKKITISNTNVISDLSNFPLMVKVTSDSDIGGVARSDGYDIRFTSSDGTTLLDYEREIFSITSGSATGIFWVCIPTVASAASTDIYIYFGKADASDVSTISFWDSDYSNVYHFGEAGSGLNDSSNYGNHLTNTGMVISGGKAALSGDDYATASFESDIGLTTNRTMCGVARTSGGTSRRCIMAFALESNDFEPILGHRYAGTNSVLSFEAGKAGVYAWGVDSDVTVGSSDIYHIAVVHKDNSEMDFYINGVYYSSYTYPSQVIGTNKVWNWTHPAVQSGDSVTFDFNGTQATYEFFGGDINATFNALFGSGNWSMTGSGSESGGNWDIELIGSLAKSPQSTPTIYAETLGLGGNNTATEVAAGSVAASTLSSSNRSLVIGSETYNNVPDYFFVGDIYEARYSSTIRSPAWIKFEAKNLLNDETTFAALESSGGSTQTLFPQKRILICA